MAVTFTSGDEDDRITLSATPDVCTQVTFHQNTRTVTLIGKAANGTDDGEVKVAFSATDNQAIGTNYITVPSGSTIQIARGKDRKLGGTVIYIASATASAIIEIRASSALGG